MNPKQRTLFLGAMSPVPEIAIGALVGVAGGGWEGFGVTLAVLYSIYFLVWLRNTIWAWVLYRWGGRALVAENMKAKLAAFKYPEAEANEGALSYFERIAMDEAQPINARLHASASHSLLSYLEGTGRTQEQMRLSWAFEDAMKAYQHGAK